MKRMWKKSLAFLLVMLLVVQLLPMGAMAAEDTMLHRPVRQCW